jgi:CRP/FNR family transcriptional regulator, anaerobic regulatory protein
MAGHAVLRLGGSCLKCPVRAGGLCAPLPPDQIRFLEHLVTGTHLYPAGSDLFRQDESCANFVTVREGWAFTYMLLEHGNRQILDFALPGAFLGVQADPAVPMRYSAQCLTSVRVCIYPKPDVYKVLRREPGFALQLCEIEACQEARLNDHLANIGQRDALARVTHLIVELFYRTHGRLPAHAGEEIEFPLRLMHISDALGITREHASRTLRALREQGICDAHGRVLRILNPSSLLELSGFEHDPKHLLASHA